MEKFSIIASKWQKKYTLIVSAESQDEAKQKLHKEGYTILSFGNVWNTNFQGNRYIFQAEIAGNIKNGIIMGNDIFKVYIKLKDELWYNVFSLYPEWDEAHNNAQKKQEIMDKLKSWYEIKKQENTAVEIEKQRESFYLNKQLSITQGVIESIIKKFETILQKKDFYQIDEQTEKNIKDIYEKLIYIKSSTNIVKLREISELSLRKIAEIEQKNLEIQKNNDAKILIEDTNLLLKQIGAKKNTQNVSLEKLKTIFAWWKKKENQSVKTQDELIDRESYAFLKNILLLEKYREKLKENTKEIWMHIFLFLNIFSKSEVKKKILLKRSVILQNISLLQARKTGKMSSYTSMKKWYVKLKEEVSIFSMRLSQGFFISIFLYCVLFFLLAYPFSHKIIFFESQKIIFVFLLFFCFSLLRISHGLFSFVFSFVFFSFSLIFILVNF